MLKALLLVVFLLQCKEAFATLPTFDAFAETSATPAAATIELTIGSITDGVVCVASGGEDIGTSGDVTNVTASGLTFVQQAEVIYNPAGTTQHISIWCAPSGTTSGAKTMTVTYDSGVDFATLFAFSFSGVDQTTPIEATNTQTYTSGTSYSQTVTSITADAMVVDCIEHNSGSAVLTVGADQTEIAQLNQGTNEVAACSYEPAATAGSKTMSWTSDTSGSRVVQGLIVLKPAVAGGSRRRNGQTIVGG